MKVPNGVVDVEAKGQAYIANILTTQSGWKAVAMQSVREINERSNTAMQHVSLIAVVVALLTVRLRKDKKGGNGKKALGAALFLMGAATYEIALAAVFAVLAAGLAVYIGIAAARIAKNKKNATVEENYEEDSEQA